MDGESKDGFLDWLALDRVDSRNSSDDELVRLITLVEIEERNAAPSSPMEGSQGGTELMAGFEGGKCVFSPLNAGGEGQNSILPRPLLKETILMGTLP